MCTQEPFPNRFRKWRKQQLQQICGVLLCGLISTLVFAQPAKLPVYAAITYYKVKPGKADQYASLIRGTTHRIHEYQFRQKSILGWYFYEVLVPSGEQTPYNYVSVMVSSNFSDLVNNPVLTKEAYEKAMGSGGNYAQLMAQLLDCRSIVKREIYTHRAGLDPRKPVSPYVEIDFMKPYPGKAPDYVKMETEVYYPIHQERMKLGALNDWGLYEKLLPYEYNAENDFITANFFDDPRSIIDPKYEEAFNSMPNNIDYIRLSSQVDQTRKMVRSDLWKLVDYIDTNNPR
jgi:hypothetical protein